MTTAPTDLPSHFNPTLDLSFEHIVDVPKDLVHWGSDETFAFVVKGQHSSLL